MGSTLSDERVDLCYVWLEGLGEDVVASLWPALYDDERERAQAYFRLEDRIAFTVGRALTRRMLSERATEPSQGWRFQQNTHGKPEIAAGLTTADLGFNISHTSGLVAVGVASGRNIGIDVERISCVPELLEIARAHFSSTEFRLLQALSPNQREETFFALWTLKEAFIKARGLGLSLPLSQFCFSLDPPVISFSPPVREEASTWLFWQDRPNSLYVSAVAMQKHTGEDLTCNVRQVAINDLVNHQ